MSTAPKWLALTPGARNRIISKVVRAIPLSRHPEQWEAVMELLDGGAARLVEENRELREALSVYESVGIAGAPNVLLAAVIQASGGSVDVAPKHYMRVGPHTRIETTKLDECTRMWIPRVTEDK